MASRQTTNGMNAKKNRSFKCLLERAGRGWKNVMTTGVKVYFKIDYYDK